VITSSLTHGLLRSVLLISKWLKISLWSFYYWFLIWFHMARQHILYDFVFFFLIKIQVFKKVSQFSHTQKEGNFLNKYQFPEQCCLSSSVLIKWEAVIRYLVSKSQPITHFPLLTMSSYERITWPLVALHQYCWDFKARFSLVPQKMNNIRWRINGIIFTSLSWERDLKKNHTQSLQKTFDNRLLMRGLAPPPFHQLGKRKAWPLLLWLTFSQAQHHDTHHR